MSTPRVIVLTGATRGLGRALVDRFAEAGHVVWGCGRSAAHVAGLAQELPAPLAAIALSPGVIDTDMLRQCWADEAGQYQGPESWSRGAADRLLALGRAENGRSLSIRDDGSIR